MQRDEILERMERVRGGQVSASFLPFAPVVLLLGWAILRML